MLGEDTEADSARCLTFTFGWDETRQPQSVAKASAKVCAEAAPLPADAEREILGPAGIAEPSEPSCFDLLDINKYPAWSAPLFTSVGVV